MGLLLSLSDERGRAPGLPASVDGPPQYSAQHIGVSKILTASSSGSAGLTRWYIQIAIFSAVGFSSPSISFSK